MNLSISSCDDSVRSFCIFDMKKLRQHDFTTTVAQKANMLPKMAKIKSVGYSRLSESYCREHFKMTSHACSLHKI